MTVTYCLPNKPHGAIELHPSNNIHLCIASKLDTYHVQQHKVNIIAINESNHNLTTTSSLAFSFGHLYFTAVQWIFCPGICDKNSVLSSAGICNNPKCTACENDKACKLSTEFTLGNVHLQERTL